jgi:hypothetical protein
MKYTATVNLSAPGLMAQLYDGQIRLHPGHEPDRVSLECNYLSFLEIVATEFTPVNQLPNVTH